MKGCKTIDEYKLKKFIEDNFADEVERHYDSETCIITVIDENKDKLRFKVFNSKVTEVEAM